jgi:MATE family multidrug resistance protein
MYMLPLATSNAVGVLVGHAIGARHFSLARSTGLTGIAVTSGLAVVAALALTVAANAVADFYTVDPHVRAVASGLLLLVGVYHVFDSTSAVAVNALRGYKRAVVPFLVNVLGLWGVGLGGGYVIGLTDALPLSALVLATPLGVPGFWIGALAGMAVAASGVVAYFLVVSEPKNVRAEAKEVAMP